MNNNDILNKLMLTNTMLINEYIIIIESIIKTKINIYKQLTNI